MISIDTIKKQVNHCTIAVSDWMAGGCNVNDIPRPEMAVLVAFQKEWLKDIEQSAQTPQPTKDNLTAFKQYLQECEDCLEVPDVAGAFNAGWQAMQKEQTLPEFYSQLEYDTPEWNVVVSVYQRREDATPLLVYRENLPNQQPAQQQVPVSRTDRQIVDETEKLAVWLLSWSFNHQSESKTPMRESTHPFAERCWAAACHIQEMLTATDPENAVAELDEGTGPHQQAESHTQQEPAKRQYYHQVNSCTADDSKSKDCICWHDEGTGPRANEPELIRSWRAKP